MTWIAWLALGLLAGGLIILVTKVLQLLLSQD